MRYLEKLWFDEKTSKLEVVFNDVELAVPVYGTTTDKLVNALYRLASLVQHLEFECPYSVTSNMVEENEWLPWRGGECPVESTVPVDSRFRSGSQENDVNH